MPTYMEVGAYEAKTHLSDFLRQVKAGAIIRITQRGEHVADLIPPETRDKRDAARAAMRMVKFMRSHQPIADLDIRALIDEGRD
jgi:prevent-host-death family protein